jgi:hypothetical protein
VEIIRRCWFDALTITKNNILQMNIEKILDEHQLWLDSSGHKGKRADLSGANLRFVKIQNRNLTHAILYSADLWYADLSGSILKFADLRSCDLEGSFLAGVEFEGASMVFAKINRANLIGVNLSYANLSESNLSGSELPQSNLYGAKLTEADIRGTDLSACNLTGVEIGDDIPVIENLILKIAENALRDETCLDMSEWHTCDTTHCIAGWACAIANRPDLERYYGTNACAALLLAKSGTTKIPNFFADKHQATMFLQGVLKNQNNE